MKGKTVLKILAAVVMADMVLSLAGCRSARTGEYYKDTKARCVSEPWQALVLAGRIPVIGWFVFLPIGGAGYALECFVVNPLWDTLMLPYDACQPHHGYYVRVLDETGAPVARARVHVSGIGGGNSWSVDDDGVTDEEGMFYIARLDYLPSWLTITAEGCHPFGGHVVCEGRRDGEYMQGKNWRVDEQGRFVYETWIFRQHRPTARQCVRLKVTDNLRKVTCWTNGYDLVKLAWTPPKGAGEHADVVFREDEKDVLTMTAAAGTELMICERRRDIEDCRFSTDYEVSSEGAVRTNVLLQAGKKSDLRLPALDVKTTEPLDYIAYRVRRPAKDGEANYYGALVPDHWSWQKDFYIFSNENPNDRSLEPCKEGVDWARSK